jgi:hypothetical protein
MAIGSPHKLVKLFLSPEEYKKLNELAKEEGFFMSAYLRNLINTFYYLRHMDEKKIMESGKLDFGGYGIEFSKDVMAEFIQNIAERVKDVDWDKFVAELNIRPTNQPKTRVRTKVKQR